MSDKGKRPVDDLFDSHKPGRRPIYEPRRKASFWIDEDLLGQLEQLKRSERDRLRAAGDEGWRLVSLNSLIGEALKEFLEKRRRKS